VANENHSALARPPNWAVGLAKMNAGKLTSRLGGAQEAAAKIIDRYLDGESIQEIADDLHCSNERIYVLLCQHAPEAWRKAQTGKALRKLEEAEIKLETAEDGIRIGSAREQARLQCWRLERVARHLYGSAEVALTVAVNVGEIGERIRILEGELLTKVDAKSET